MGNVSFVNRNMMDIEPGSFDLVTNHDCIHDLPDPVGALTAVRNSLKQGGEFFSVEPKVKDPEDTKFSPQMGQVFAMSALHCVPVSLALGGPGYGSGTFGPKTYEKLTNQAGFTEFAVVGSNPMNNFYQIKGGAAARL